MQVVANLQKQESQILIDDIGVIGLVISCIFVLLEKSDNSYLNSLISFNNPEKCNLSSNNGIHILLLIS